MGQLTGKLRCLPRCCSCCDEAASQRTSTATARFKVLLLGASGSGKTELGHLLSGTARDAQDRGATNGVRCYRLAAEASLLLTEVGGSTDMQRLWLHYYAASHGLIYCFDLSASSEQLLASFALLQRCLQQATLRGKPVLLVAGRHSEAVQLYDVEHAFGLEQLARDCGCPLRICHMDDHSELWHGVAWLLRQLHELAPALDRRIKYDLNMQTWQRRRRALLANGKPQQPQRQRFQRQHRKLWPMQQSTEVAEPRPRTAPAAVFSVRMP